MNDIRVLVATDGSECSRAAVTMLQQLPLPEKVEATLLSVAPGLATTSAEHEAVIKELADEAERLVSEEATQLSELGWKTQTLVREGHVAQQIVKAADELDCKLLVVGSHGMTGLTHFLLGSVAEKVVKHAGCSVLVGRVQDKPKGSDSSDVVSTELPSMKILLAIDGSETARAAVELLSAWPLGEQTEVTLLGVMPVATTSYRMDIVERTSESWLEQKQELQAELDAAAEQIGKATPKVNVVLKEGGPNPSHEILEAASQLDADLIVVGHKGKSAIERFLMGSVSNRVVRYADRSVLVVRP